MVSLLAHPLGCCRGTPQAQLEDKVQTSPSDSVGDQGINTGLAQLLQ